MKSIASVVLAACAMALPGLVQAQEHTHGIEDVAFLAGHWAGADERGRPEEGWFGPAGRIMTGMFRWPSAEGRYVIELLTIAEEDDGVYFRFKHFDPDLTAWEQAHPNTYRLSEAADGCATFTGTEVNQGSPATIRYCRTEDERLIFYGAAAGEDFGQAEFTLEFTPQ